MSSFAVDWGPRFKLLDLAWLRFYQWCFQVMIACLPGTTQRLLADKKWKNWVSEYWDFPDLNVLYVWNLTVLSYGDNAFYINTSEKFFLDTVFLTSFHVEPLRKVFPNFRFYLISAPMQSKLQGKNLYDQEVPIGQYWMMIMRWTNNTAAGTKCLYPCDSEAKLLKVGIKHDELWSPRVVYSVSSYRIYMKLKLPTGFIYNPWLEL